MTDEFSVFYPAGSRLAQIMKNKHKHHRSGYINCKECAKLLAKDETLNVYWCSKCNKASVASKPTICVNCPCINGDLELIIPDHD